MTNTALSTLDDLMAAPQPAWLWDPVAGRIVWANQPGIACFGGDTLFDLIDREFDMREPGLVRVRQLVCELQRGQVSDELLSWPSAGLSEDFTARCQIYALADGRDGILVIAASSAPQISSLAPAMALDVLRDFPAAMFLTTAEGQVIFANYAAEQLVVPLLVQHMLDILIADGSWAKWMQRLVQAGTVTAQCTAATDAGQRQFRLTLRNSPDIKIETGAVITVLLQDVTERRALERRLSGMTEPNNTPSSRQSKPDQLALGEKPTRSFEEPGRSLKPKVEKPIKAESKTISPSEIPHVIQQFFDNLPEPSFLHGTDQVYYANQATLQLFACSNLGELQGNTQFSTILDAINARTSALKIETNGQVQDYVVQSQPFPWRNGAAFRTLLKSGDSPPPISEPLAAKTTTIAKIDSSPITSNNPVLDTTLEKTSPPPATIDQEEMAELRAILDTAADGLVTLNQKGEILSFSAGAQAMLGRSAEAVEKMPFVDLFSKASIKVVRDYLAALSDGGLASVFNDGREVKATVGQSGEIPIFLTIGRMRNVGRASHCAVLRDITQWKKTESELKAAKETAEESSAQKSDFLARISHELRTPLNAILGFSDVMRTERFGAFRNERYLGYAQDIHTSGEHLLSLINDLLDLSKVEAGKLELNFASVSLSALVEDCVNLMRDQATAQQVVIRSAVSSQLPNVVADNRAMKQVLYNLVSNAIKFTDAGGQVIISARVTRDNGELVLRIKDTGIGMDKTQLQAALEPFHQVDNSDRDPAIGTGLGLPLSKALTEANRARFDITSKPKKGTMVEVIFPSTRVLAE